MAATLPDCIDLTLPPHLDYNIPTSAPHLNPTASRHHPPPPTPAPLAHLSYLNAAHPKAAKPITAAPTIAGLGLRYATPLVTPTMSGDPPHHGALPASTPPQPCLLKATPLITPTTSPSTTAPSPPPHCHADRTFPTMPPPQPLPLQPQLPHQSRLSPLATLTITLSPPRSEVIIGADGLWGVHEWTVYPQFHHPEFPYLAWIPLHSSNTSFPSDIITRSIDKSMWQAHLNKSNIHSIHRDVLDELMVKWKSTKAALEDPFSTISFDLSSVWCPRQAYNRAFEALSRLANPEGFEAWCDFVEVFHNLQQSLLELHAFLDWWEDNRTGNKFRSPIRAPTRGSIFEDMWLYANYMCQSIGALLLIHKSIFSLDPTKEVALSPCKLCKTQPMSLHAPIKALHLWYYPPLMHNIVTELETAAWGYAERLDTFNLMMGFKRKMEKSKNKVNDEALRMAKKAKTDLASKPNNQELRCLTDAGATPYWFLKIQEVWKHAVGHVSHLGLASQESSRRFALPPIHLFWGGEPPNQHVYYHHYLLLFNEIKNWPECDLPALTTHERRSILGNSYWKKQWPKHDGNSSSTFDPNIFWKYRGALAIPAQPHLGFALPRTPTSMCPPFRSRAAPPPGLRPASPAHPYAPSAGLLLALGLYHPSPPSHACVRRVNREGWGGTPHAGSPLVLGLCAPSFRVAPFACTSLRPHTPCTHAGGLPLALGLHRPSLRVPPSRAPLPLAHTSSRARHVNREG
ncbi:hypothetical protein EDB89DRAFT_2230399 [Lactarius sanguifluus]|nr:hypothetical protein EDB89DRAFT_2230399 [Lactarius sanguifluus]